MAASNHEGPAERRSFLRGMLVTVSGALAGCAGAAAAHAEHPSAHAEGDREAEVTPGEDLMQEHGVLERILLIYDEATRRIERNEAFDGALVASAAGIVRRFVEEYHEQNEEQFVFPRLEKAQREAQLVATLRLQHQRGRQLTDDIIQRSGSGASAELANRLAAFVRMYRPHAAREETVLIPAFRRVVGASAYRELGEQFEDREHERFGEHGFEDTVAAVAGIEAALGIADLASFTPPA